MISKDQLVQVATSDEKGTPHVAAVKGVNLLDDEHVAFEDWFCAQTLRNIEENPRVALSLMRGEKGFQLIGMVDREVATELLDGLIFGEASRFGTLPGAKHRLEIRVDKIMELRIGPHSDDSRE